MKYKTSELTGALLDAAVAKAVGLQKHHKTEDGWAWGSTESKDDEIGWLVPESEYTPSTNWVFAGPIMERNDWALPRANHYQHTQHLGGYVSETPGAFCYYGATPLIAAMRAVVAAKLGEEVEL
jgi:hypothetical protein